MNKQILNKLLKIAQKQQAIIKKLAGESLTKENKIDDQYWDKGRSRWWSDGPLDPSDVRNHDPLYAGPLLPEDRKSLGLFVAPPKPKWMDAFMEKQEPTLTDGFPKDVNNLPPQIVSKLDSGPAKNFKGKLLIDVNEAAKYAKVRSQSKARPDDVRKALELSVPGFTFEVIREFSYQDDPRALWKPNY